MLLSTDLLNRVSSVIGTVVRHTTMANVGAPYQQDKDLFD
jgi:hypothetical protein